MEINISEDNEVNIDNEVTLDNIDNEVNIDNIDNEVSLDNLQQFKERWSVRDTNSVQEITLQHLETNPSTDSKRRPTINEHQTIYDDFNKVTYKQIEREINDCYLDENHSFSSSLDILASYLKGQKIIYMEAKTYADTYLNYLMLRHFYFCHRIRPDSGHRMHRMGRNHHLRNERISRLSTRLGKLP